jgi:hypothetical protein
LALSILSGWAYGDRVVLKDGRSFEGTVTRSEKEVHVELAYGKISFPAADVASIETKPTASDQVEMQLRITRREPDALFQIAVFARENDLLKRSEEILQDVIALKGDHAGAHKLLGHVQVDKKWVELKTAIQIAKGRLAAGKADSVLKDMLPGMEEAASDPKAKLPVRELEAACRLRAGQFDKAKAIYDDLAAKAAGGEAVRFAAQPRSWPTTPTACTSWPSRTPPPPPC